MDRMGNRNEGTWVVWVVRQGSELENVTLSKCVGNFPAFWDDYQVEERYCYCQIFYLYIG